MNRDEIVQQVRDRQFKIGDPVIVFAAECNGFTNGAILNVRFTPRHIEYLVATSFYIKWIRLSPENTYDASRLATNILPVDLPNPCSLRQEDLPPEHTIDDLGS